MDNLKDINSLFKIYEQKIFNLKGDMLISLFDNLDCLQRHFIPETENILFNDIEVNIIKNKDEFLKNFHNISNNMFINFNFKEILIIGTSVLFPFCNIKEHDIKFIDFYIYGKKLLNEEQKIKNMIQHLKYFGKLKYKFHDNWLIFKLEEIDYKIRINLINFDSIENILNSIKIDCHCLVFDGEKILTNLRGFLSLKYQLNFFDQTKFDENYMENLISSFNIGFSLFLPKFDKFNIDPFIYKKKYQELNLFQKLLYNINNTHLVNNSETCNDKFIDINNFHLACHKFDIKKNNKIILDENNLYNHSVYVESKFEKFCNVDQILKNENYIDFYGRNILHLSIIFNYFDNFKTLLEKNFSLKNYKDKSILHLIVEYSDIKYLEFFINFNDKNNKNYDYNYEDNNGLTALHYCIINNDFSCILLLLDKKSDKKNKYSALEICNLYFKNDIALYLIQKQKIKDELYNEKYILYKAAENENVELVNILINNGNNINFLSKYENNFESALLVALKKYKCCKSENLKQIIKNLIKNGANLFQSEELKNIIQPIEYLTNFPDFEIIKFVQNINKENFVNDFIYKKINDKVNYYKHIKKYCFLYPEIKIDEINIYNNCQNILYYLDRNNQSELINFDYNNQIEFYGYDENNLLIKRDKKKEYIKLFKYTFFKNFTELNNLFIQTENLEIITFSSFNNLTPFHLAILNDDTIIFDILLKKIYDKINQNDPLIFLNSPDNKKNIVDYLLNFNCKKILYSIFKRTEFYYLDIKNILKNKLIFKHVLKKGWSDLAFLLFSENIIEFEYKKKYDRDCFCLEDEIKKNFFKEYLFESIKLGQTRSLLFLLKYLNKKVSNININLEITDDKKNNLFHILFQENIIDNYYKDLIICTKFILKQNFELINKTNEDGDLPINFLSKSDSKRGHEIIQYLLEQNNKLISNKKGYSLIHYICQIGNIKMCNVLLRFYPKMVNMPTEKEKFLPIMIALKNQNMELVELLIAKGSELSHNDIFNNNFYHFVAKYGDLKLLNKFGLKNEENNFCETSADYFNARLRNYFVDKYKWEILRFKKKKNSKKRQNEILKKDINIMLYQRL
ncbi:Hypothetical protein KVN_LOCUS156 [uncultured virus]|nr:Hypothetical protein KVN_LOCUS156 [uncultured virus]